MISVIMPVFNTKRYLMKAIESVLCQTFQDWELIIVDDGSFENNGNYEMIEKLNDVFFFFYHVFH